MELEEEFNKISKLMVKSEYQKAFDEVKKLENIKKSPDDYLTFLNLKADITYRIGSFKKALNLAQNALKESEKQANQLQAVNALILESTIFWRLGQFTDSMEVIDKGETILNRMKDIDELLMMKKKARFLYRRSTVYSSLGNFNLSFKFAKESLALREKIGDKEDIANSLNSVANFYLVTGDLDKALSHYKRSLHLFEEIDDVEAIGMILINVGFLYILKGEFGEALANFQRTITILEEFGNNTFYASGLGGVGYVYLLQGKLNEALECFQKSLNICEEIGDKESIAMNLGVIGSAYTGKGELKTALKNLQKCLEICEEIGVSKGPYVGWYLNFIGRIYFVKGDYKIALDYYQRALAIFKELGNPIAIVTTLFTLVKINIELRAFEEAKEYVNQMKRLNEKKYYRSADQMYRVTQAMLLKTSDRAIQRAEAQKILQQVATEELISLELAVDVFLNLSDLLLDELKSTGSDEALTEIKNYSNHLLELSKTQHSYYLLSETYLLQSKLALLELDISGSQNLLSQAELIAEEKGLGKLSKKITQEKDLSSALIENIEKLIDKQPSISEIIELTKLEDFFEQMLNKRIYSKDAEILEYAVQARALVQTTGKG